MCKIIILTGSLLFFSAGYAQSVSLTPVMTPVDNLLPIVKDSTLIPCNQIINQMVTHNQLSTQHEQSLVAFLNDVQNQMTSWYGVLSPLEGSAQTLATGTFLPLQDGATKTAQIIGMASNNSTLIAYDLAHIVASLRACTITGP